MTAGGWAIAKADTSGFAGRDAVSDTGGVSVRRSLPLCGKPHHEHMTADALRKSRCEIERRALLDGANGRIDEPLSRLLVADDTNDGRQRSPEQAAVTPEAELHGDE